MNPVTEPVTTTGSTTMRLIILGLIAALTLLAVPAASAASAPSSPHQLTFTKTDLEGDFVWDGSVDGDTVGGLQTRLTAARPAGEILHVEFDWEIDAGDESFVAHLVGTLNQRTGAVVMNGEVVEGFMLGARVHERGQLTDPGTSEFQGTITILPATG